MNLTHTSEKITVDEYQYFRDTTDWKTLDKEMIEKGLKQDLFSIKIYDQHQLIGMGRVVGDGAIYFYIQDVIVIPEYIGKGVGKKIMQHIESYLQQHACNNSFIGLMAADGLSEFYHQFGYKTRPENAPGMYKYSK